MKKIILTTSAILMSLFSLRQMANQSSQGPNVKTIIENLEQKVLIATCGSGTHGGSKDPV